MKDQKKFKLACNKADKYSLPVRGKERPTIGNRNADER